jgi:hypothetical protein
MERLNQLRLGFAIQNKEVKVAKKTKPKRQMKVDENTTVHEAREFCRENRDSGCICPCCGQDVKMYNYKFHSSLAQCMIGLVRVFEQSQNWVHVKDIPVPGGRASDRGGHLAKAVHWGLIEAKPNDDSSKRTSGLWQPTQKGRDFVHGRISISKYVHLFNNTVHGFSMEITTIKQALGDKFDYAELIGSKPS